MTVSSTARPAADREDGRVGGIVDGDACGALEPHAGDDRAATPDHLAQPHPPAVDPGHRHICSGAAVAVVPRRELLHRVASPAATLLGSSPRPVRRLRASRRPGGMAAAVRAHGAAGITITRRAGATRRPGVAHGLGQPFGLPRRQLCDCAPRIMHIRLSTARCMMICQQCRARVMSSTMTLCGAPWHEATARIEHRTPPSARRAGRGGLHGALASQVVTLLLIAIKRGCSCIF